MVIPKARTWTDTFILLALKMNWDSTVNIQYRRDQQFLLRSNKPGVCSKLGWRKTPPNFKFTANCEKFTHPPCLRDHWRNRFHIVWRCKAVISGIETTGTIGKLGAILAQFPRVSRITSRINGLSSRNSNIGEYPLAVELRHKSWEWHTCNFTITLRISYSLGTDRRA